MLSVYGRREDAMQASIPGQPCAVQEEAFAFVFPPGMRPDLERARAIFEEGGQEGR